MDIRKVQVRVLRDVMSRGRYPKRLLAAGTLGKTTCEVSLIGKPRDRVRVLFDGPNGGVINRIIATDNLELVTGATKAPAPVDSIPASDVEVRVLRTTVHNVPGGSVGKLLRAEHAADIGKRACIAVPVRFGAATLYVKTNNLELVTEPGVVDISEARRRRMRTAPSAPRAS